MVNRLLLRSSSKKNLNFFELVRDNATKPIGINVKQSKICKKTKLFRKIIGNVAIVEVEVDDDEKGTV